MTDEEYLDTFENCYLKQCKYGTKSIKEKCYEFEWCSYCINENCAEAIKNYIEFKRTIQEE